MSVESSGLNTKTKNKPIKLPIQMLNKPPDKPVLVISSKQKKDCAQTVLNSPN